MRGGHRSGTPPVEGVTTLVPGRGPRSMAKIVANTEFFQDLKPGGVKRWVQTGYTIYKILCVGGGSAGI